VKRKNDSKNKAPDINDALRHISPTVALDDVQRVRVLSPAMLVFKRFIRSSLAITGLIFIIAMFLFSFVGGWISPYSQSQIFTSYEEMSKDYAGVTENTEYKFTTVDGSEFPVIARSQFILAINNKKQVMSSQGVDYSINMVGDDFYQISGLVEVANMVSILGTNTIAINKNAVVDAGFKDAFSAAYKSGSKEFESGGVKYSVISSKKGAKAYLLQAMAIVTKNIFDFSEESFDTGYDFRYEAELALNKIKTGESSVVFSADGNEFNMTYKDEIAIIYSGDTVYANISKYNVQSIFGDIFLTIDFKTKVKEYINSGIKEFKYPNEDGTERTYTIIQKDKQWTIKWTEETLVIMDYASPSLAHPLGTDGNGMDLVTRIMYGGRISLMIGFIVVAIETLLGVILGGIAGYFGKWIDNLLMRLVDIFNCIPSLPLIIIIGAVMNELRVDPQVRMIYLMLMLGLLGWPGVARLVRGQILSLREQEFMIAAEATGLSVRRRIFVHLVPNVIPQLIVVSTMSLGSVILTESVLSFLGLGVKFPFASWGNIINAVSNVYVMTNYLFVWIPAGLCILITVLGFNFIGDGLRDAFDPKMKR
jgi:peptide/nickel transport system permease protein